MNNYGYNPNNTLAQFLSQYIPQQPQTSQESTQSTQQEPQRVNNSSITTFEINAKSDLEYLEPEKSGRLQMAYCRPEKRVYVGRYNFARQEMEWEAFLSEGEVNLSKSNNNNADLSQVAEALVAVVNKLESMDKSINEIRTAEPKVIEKIIEKPVEVVKEIVIEKPVEVETKPKRDSNGKFIKKGDDK